MKKGLIISILFLISISLVSAGLFSDVYGVITGNAVITDQIHPYLCPGWNPDNCASGMCGFYDIGGSATESTKCIGDSDDDDPCLGDEDDYQLGTGCCAIGKDWYSYNGYDNGSNVCCDGDFILGTNCEPESSCGNNICGEGESYETCPIDCKEVYPNFCPGWQASNCASGMCGWYDVDGGIYEKAKCIGDSDDDLPCIGDPDDEFQLGDGCCDAGGGWYFFNGFSGKIGGVQKVCCDKILSDGTGCEPEGCTDECTQSQTGCSGDIRWFCELQGDGCYDKVDFPCSEGETCSEGICSVSENPCGDGLCDTSSESCLNCKQDCGEICPLGEITEIGTIFVTNQTYNGDLGGIEGADFICQQSAIFAGLQGGWIALLSDNVIDAKDRIPDVAFVKIDGTLIAGDKEDLFDGSINLPIDLNEFGNIKNTRVWSATNTDGTLLRWTDDDRFFYTSCLVWTKSVRPHNFHYGLTGFSNESSSLWISDDTLIDCTNYTSLYCVRTDGYVMETESHMECVGSSCDVVSGGGIDECNNDFQCSADISDTCSGDFNCDGNIDAVDVTKFLEDYGRNRFNEPCTKTDTCNGDFDCDGNVDADDVEIFNSNFGRNQYNRPCPSCIDSTCDYPDVILTVQTELETYEIGESVFLTGEPQEFQIDSSEKSYDLNFLNEDYNGEDQENFPVDPSQFLPERDQDLDFNNESYVKGELIVKFRDNPDFSENGAISRTIFGRPHISSDFDSINDINKKYELEEYDRVFEYDKDDSELEVVVKGIEDIYKINFDEGVDIETLIEEYENDPNVEYVEYNNYVHSFFIPNDEYYDMQYNHQIIQSELAWDIEKGDSDVIIAIIDSAIWYIHDDLQPNMWKNPYEIVNGIDDDGNGFIDDIRGWDFSEDDNDPMTGFPYSNHGTHCAGVAAGVLNNDYGISGLCGNCTIMPVRFLNNGGQGSDLDGANAIMYAADNGADIISMSWGGKKVSETLQIAIDYAYNKGVVLIAAAGNTPTPELQYPSSYENVIAVTATDEEDNRASFTTYGSWTDVAAPGVSIVSTVSDSFGSMSGTSMATPLVSGLAGLILSRNPGLSNDEVRTIIEDNGDEIEFPVYIGKGRINAYKALKSTPSTSLESKIENRGITDVSGLLSIIVQEYDGSWSYISTIVQESTPRTILSGDYLSLESIWSQGNSYIPNKEGLFRIKLQFQLESGFNFVETWDFKVVKSCIINSVYWDSNSVIEGDKVSLIVDGTNCEDKYLNYSIYSESGEIIISITTRSEEYKWEAIWDGEINSNDNYYFTVSSVLSEVQSNILSVSPFPDGLLKINTSKDSFNVDESITLDIESIIDNIGFSDIQGYLYINVHNNEISQITDTNSEKDEMDLYGDNLVYSDDPEDGPYKRYTDILLYDFTTDVTTSITTDELYQARRPSIDGDKIVYDSKRIDSTYDVYMYDLLTGVETRISPDDSTSHSDPSINGDKIVWIDRRNDNYADIYTYDLLTQTESGLSFHGRKAKPKIYGNTIVYEDSSQTFFGSRFENINMYDLLTETDRALTSADNLFHYDPDIYENIIVWEDWRDSAFPSYVMANIYMCDISIPEGEKGACFPESSHTQITSYPHFQVFPKIYGSRIIYKNHRIDQYISDYDIYMCDLSIPDGEKGACFPHSSHTLIVDNIPIPSIGQHSNLYSGIDIYDNRIVYLNNKTNYNFDIFLYDLNLNSIFIQDEENQRNVISQTSLSLSDIFNSLDIKLSEQGEYVVSLEFRDVNGKILDTKSGRLEGRTEFSVI